ncbi:hypothetical protein BDV34DRAFT_16002 [Aspergillus parasiticus]|uniref:Uncharacterized protein n=1 Tax=Aspergillus parasiticus TaxID=5067 RepID=A0A5N6DZB0_ASPPA|nr:hypothetical protein BDV34DRAFT_16002 [Aspergillus parasiticus]
MVSISRCPLSLSLSCPFSGCSDLFLGNSNPIQASNRQTSASETLPMIKTRIGGQINSGRIHAASLRHGVLIKINTDWAALRKQSGAKHSVTRVQRPLVHSAAAEVPYEWGMRRSDG